MKRLMDRLQRWMDDYSIRKKLLILYVVCVLFPLVLTDAVILYIVFDINSSRRNLQALHLP